MSILSVLPTSSFTASTTYTVWTPNRIADGIISLSNGWQPTGSMNEWITVDLGSPKLFNRMVLNNYTSTNGLKNFIIQGSNDNLVFDNIYSGTALVSNNVNTQETFEFVNNTKYRYFRLYCLDNHGATRIAIVEIGLYYDVTATMLVLYKGDYYYYNLESNIWTSLGQQLPSYQDFSTYGMFTIGSEISTLFDGINSNFRIIYGIDGNVELISTMNALPPNQQMYPTEDISLVGIEKINSFKLLSTGDTKIAVSFDRGVTWKSFVSGNWITIDNPSEGMSQNEFNSLSSNQIESIRDNSNHIRFSYYLTQTSAIDSIELKITLQGTEKLASTTDFNISYRESDNTIVYTINKSGSYSVNYVDA